ncbi:hypothetical protein PVK06_017343 [Gossypium arboreum]|uniref:Uncharacterized protein n=1 Tax=Gossypium arboreum TaxID=29729 RepID=A0ABR0Q2E8_GOSAR|nr:hypothetical protein PVK06_017343 [Gossypium arboreum]
MRKRGSSNRVMIVVSTGSGRVASAPKFKRHRVSEVRDFLPGCGRVTAPNFRLSRQITVDRSSQSSDTREFLVLYVIRWLCAIPIMAPCHLDHGSVPIYYRY